MTWWFLFIQTLYSCYTTSWDSTTIADLAAADFIFRHFYFRSVDIDPVLGWLMAFAVVAALVVRYRQKVDLDRRGPDDSTTREYMEVNIAVYAAIVLTLWFFSSWFVNVGSGGRPLDSTLGLPVFVLMAGTTGCNLWRDIT